jgi:hypothetical protein
VRIEEKRGAWFVPWQDADHIFGRIDMDILQAKNP